MPAGFDSIMGIGNDATAQQIAELEKQIAGTKYNKSTQGAIGAMKAKLAMLKQKREQRVASKVGKSTDGYAVRKTGDGTVVLLGFPSAGKSTLLNTLTGAGSAVGAYAFTTLTVIPGMLDYKFAKIQILDVPGIIEGAASGQGRGKEVLQVIRNADLVLIVIDVFNIKQYAAILKEINETGIRINKRKPDVKITRTMKNGIRVGRTVELPDLDDATIENICKTFRIVNADVLIRSVIDADDLIDVLEANKVYLPAVTVLNKIDIADQKTLAYARSIVKPDLEISAHAKINIPELKELIFQKMDFIRIFLKPNGGKADMDEPMIMQRGQTLRSLCEKLHKDFVDRFRFARIWGPSAKFSGQKILKLDHELGDTDIVEIYLT
jgi:uncharacterized protein